MDKLHYGVGINDLSNKTSANGKHFGFYRTWKSMLQRCYSSRYHTRHPTYKECYVHDSWLSLSNFNVWYDANYIAGFELDKDILIPGNKMYGPETCAFVPGALNRILYVNTSKTGIMPPGITAHKKRKHILYQASCQTGDGGRVCKSSRSLTDMQLWYAATKRNVIKEVALKSFLANEIKTDVYLALIRRLF